MAITRSANPIPNIQGNACEFAATLLKKAQFLERGLPLKATTRKILTVDETVSGDRLFPCPSRLSVGSLRKGGSFGHESSIFEKQVPVWATRKNSGTAPN